MGSVLKFIVHIFGFLFFAVAVYMFFMDPAFAELSKNSSVDNITRWVVVIIVVLIWGGCISLIDKVFGRKS